MKFIKLLFVLFFLIGCGGGGGSGSGSNTSTASSDGVTISAMQNAEPTINQNSVAGKLYVDVSKPTLNENTDYKAITDIYGDYVLKNIPAGKYTLVLTHPAILHHLTEATPNVVLDVQAKYYTNTKEFLLTLTHKGGDPLDLRNIEIALQTESEYKRFQVFKLGEGFTSLKAYYYRLNKTATNPGSSNPDDIVFDDLVLSQYEDSINYHWGLGGPAGLSNYFGVEWVGELYVPESGNYTFYLTSDDGSWLYIDGNLIIDNGGLHPPKEKYSGLHLKSGIHHFEVRMFEHYGGAVIYLEYARGVALGRKPVESFYHTQ
jgi:hypothetical protein